MNKRKKLEWIQIENFRGIKKVKLQEFGDINVFIGKNNTGKSTVLEAIYLNVTNGHLDLLGRIPFELVFYRRGLNPRDITDTEKADVEEYMEYILSYLFNSLSNKNYIRIQSNVSQYELVLKQGSEVSPDFIEEYISGYQTAISVTKKILEALTQDQESKDEKILEMLNQLAVEGLHPEFVLMTPKGRIVMAVIKFKHKGFVDYQIFLERNPETGRANAILIDEYLTRGYLGTTAKFSKLLKRLDRIFKPKLESVKELLAQQITLEIQNIIETLSEFYIITKDGKAIPVSLLGDGTKTSLIYFYVLSGKGNYILLEEPENHLHAGLMNKVINMILEASRYNQIFITTHSLEFLEKLLDMAVQKKTDLRIFRFEKWDKGIPKIESYDLNEANAAVNKIGVDLR
ncbi:hypothetical protein PAP_06135 [Palaeococcus pacificus DY20341]|uniref:Endonuclease GajA/Old nuclease/RecF-like AAA domain-containing protein n=1 Tax=Palaeococcus pacificus DY20341 TaxID=1343739 RepID=A0A075LUH3_9EURY|nr:ATP-binding protein [Palaeococcus pacificus]AIF69627.1 hypothetical protein PAP_06135 [Palaeococcus pacificus DY20341]